ncbi:MAG: PP2C family protein-serine/threonine phosphatase [Anaerolineales bacterium]|nr:PP2C family protein-serine/threonine phosphatase [Anaerolineales bacterium]
MNDPAFPIASRLNPELNTLSGQRRLGGVADVITFLYTLPLALAAVIWLALVSDWQAARQGWLVILLAGVLMYLFNRLSFFLITEIRAGGYANTQGSLDDMVLWTGAFLVGPVVLWLEIVANVISLVNGMRRATSMAARWSQARLFTATVASNTLTLLAALLFHERLGGQIPLGMLTWQTILLAMLAMVAQVALRFVVYSGYIAYVAWSLKNLMGADPRPALMFFVYAFVFPALANPFAILAATLYVRDGVLIFIFDMIGLLLVALLARRLSQAAEISRQQSRQLERLERLGRELLKAPPDGSTLTGLLNEYVPNMFASRGIAIWLEPGRLLLSHPPEWSPPLQQVWAWLQQNAQDHAFLADEELPWEEQGGNNRRTPNHEPVVVAPILNVETGSPFGMVYLELQTLAIPWNRQAIEGIAPAVQSISAQIASALHQAHTYQESLTMQKALQELQLARTIQASFLPESLPQLPGWQVAATLEPARQIAGDFYDFIHFHDGKLGILIADVADKGLGPALYMALSRTLIRTYAEQYPADPAAVLQAANRRILEDARANLFVTVFYGVLDPATGLLTYANAGHTPPYLITAPGVAEKTHLTLRNTGMPLGIDSDAVWRYETAEMRPGEKLLLYTDGVTDAQNSNGEFIDRRFILELACSMRGSSVHDLAHAILEEVHHFIADAPRFDDITLVLVGRET